MSLIIQPESFLKSRDIRIHEASHCAVGTILRLPMSMPEVFKDGSGGVANFDWDEIRASADSDDRHLDEIDYDQQLNAGTHIAAMYLAGFAGEAIASKTEWRQIIGARSHDLQKACQALDLVKAPEEIYLSLAWHTALEILYTCWPTVMKLADMIPETDGTHRPPQFH